MSRWRTAISAVVFLNITKKGLDMSKSAGGWHCKKCKGKFETMAEMKYHKCEPAKFKRPAKVKRSRAR